MFTLESTQFIELRVLEECIKLKKQDQNFINKAVDDWIDILGIDNQTDWFNVLIPQLKKSIYNNLKEGRYYYARV